MKYHKITKSLFFILLVLLLFECKEPNSDFLSREVDETLIGREVNISSFLYRPLKIVANDDVLIVYDRIDNEMFKFFTYPDIRYLFSWGKKGRGPKENRVVIHQSISAKRNTLSFIDFFTLKKYKIIPPDKVEIEDRIDLNTERGLMNGFCTLNDSIFFADNFTGIDKNEHVFIFPDEQIGKTFGQFPNDEFEFEEPIQKMIYYSKASVANPNEKKIMTFYKKLNLIKLYDYEGTLLKNFGLSSSKQKYSKPIENSKIVFTEPFSTDSYIYVLFIDKNSVEIPQTNPQMLVLDWEGEFIRRYILDKPIITFTVSERHGKIYGVYPDGGTKLIEFDIPFLKDKSLSQIRKKKITTNYYETIIPKNWDLNLFRGSYGDSTNMVDENFTFYDSQIDAHINANVLFPSSSPFLDYPCGASINIFAFIPNESSNLDKLFKNIYSKYFREYERNYKFDKFALNNKTISNYYYEISSIHPEGFNINLKTTGWLWKENNKILFIKFNGCKEYENELFKAQQVLDEMKVKS